jgi:hypothetical protein
VGELGESVTKPYEVSDAQRDDGALSAAELISAYEHGVADLRAAVSGLTADELRRRPCPASEALSKSSVTSPTASSSSPIG